MEPTEASDKKDLIPVTPPPDFLPESVPVFASKDMIKSHMGKYIYVRMYSGEHFWMSPTQEDGTFVRGYVWNGRTWHLKELLFKKIEGVF